MVHRTYVIYHKESDIFFFELNAENTFLKYSPISPPARFDLMSLFAPIFSVTDKDDNTMPRHAVNN
jgi:hypothetical protein